MEDKIILSEYTPEWEKIYKTEAKSLRGALGGKVTLYHVGSTAVKGIIARPVVDILIIVKSIVSLDKSALGKLGYHELGVSDADVCVFTKKGDASVSLTVTESKNNEKIQKYVTVRDFLRANRDEAEAYSHEKKRLAELVNGDEPYDFRDYSYGKAEYLKGLEERADKWRERENHRSVCMSLGMCFGMSAGTCIGVAMQNLSLWMCIGMSIGLCLGLSVGELRRKK